MNCEVIISGEKWSFSDQEVLNLQDFFHSWPCSHKGKVFSFIQILLNKIVACVKSQFKGASQDFDLIFVWRVYITTDERLERCRGQPPAAGASAQFERSFTDPIHSLSLMHGNKKSALANK